MAGEKTDGEAAPRSVPAPLMIVLILSVFAMAAVALAYAVHVRGVHAEGGAGQVTHPAAAPK